jgi:hypothetical protein
LALRRAITKRDAADLRLCDHYTNKLFDEDTEEVLLLSTLPNPHPWMMSGGKPVPLTAPSHGPQGPHPARAAAEQPAPPPCATTIKLDISSLSNGSVITLGKLSTQPSEKLLAAATLVVSTIVGRQPVHDVDKSIKSLFQIGVDGYGIAPGLAGHHTLHHAAHEGGFDLDGSGSNNQVVTIDPSGSATLDGASYGSTSRMLAPAGDLETPRGPPFKHLDANLTPTKLRSTRAAALEELVAGTTYASKAPVDEHGVRHVAINASLKEKIERRTLVQTNVATAIAAAVSTQYDAARQNEPSSPTCDRLQTLNDKIIRFLEADVQALCPIDEAITPITLMLSLIVPGSNTGSILLAMTKDTFRDEYKLDFFGSFGSLLVGTPISPSETPSAYLARIITLAKSGK